MDEWSEAALRERIETTRNRMSETIEQIGERVAPDRWQPKSRLLVQGTVLASAVALAAGVAAVLLVPPRSGRARR